MSPESAEKNIEQSPYARQTQGRMILRVTSGNFLEQFDFFLFGFFAVNISRTFFPSGSEFASLMLTLSVFGAGFLMRPLGAVVLGGYIDEVGRRRGLIVTLSIMACGTGLIALVPSYARLGALAPALVVVGRLLQGFSAGAEMGGVSVYLAERAPPGHRGFYTAWQSASQQVSIILASALGYGLHHWLSPLDVDEWGWRIPFLIGCSIIPCIYMLRRSLEETAEFHAHNHPPDTRELLATLRTHWTTVFYGMLLGAMTTVTFNLITVYTPTFARTVLNLSATDSLLVTLCIGVSNFFWLPVGGALSDRIGRPAVLITVATFALGSAYPAFAWLAGNPSLPRLLGVQLLLSLYYGLYNGAMIPALIELIPPRIRVMGFSLAFSLAAALFGGVTLAMSTFLISETGNKAAPGYWMSFAAACGLVSTLALYRRKRPPALPM